MVKSRAKNMVPVISMTAGAPLFEKKQMRILVISNFYPPVRPGGYAQWCHEVTEHLRERGHILWVLTSNYQRDQADPAEKNVSRLLHLEGDLEYYQPGKFFLNYKRHQRENSANLKRIINSFRPDLLFIWGMWSMSNVLPALAEQIMPSRVVYFLSDYWPANTDRHTVYWKNPPRHWYLRGAKNILGHFALSVIAKDSNPKLKLEHTITVSKAVKDILVEAGLPLQNARVIHGGTDVQRFDNSVERNFTSRPMKFLYAGQLVNHKGVHTAVEAISRLVKTQGCYQVKLSIAGSGHPAYIGFLINMIRRERIENHVEIFGPVSKEEMPAIMEQHSVLIFPSIYEEPFARMTQEAMLSGMVVVGTPTGGTKEILADGKNGLVFHPEDAVGLADKLSLLIEDPQLCQQLASNARQTVLANYTLNRMVDDIEKYLTNVLSC